MQSYPHHAVHTHWMLHSGLGLELCRRMLDKDLSELVMVGRNKQRVDEAAEDLREEVRVCWWG